MGLLARLTGRRSGPVEHVHVEPEPVPASLPSARDDASWSRPEHLGDHEAALARIMLTMRAQVADLPAADALRIMGQRYGGWETEAIVPARGQQRTGWSDRRTFEALSREGDYLTPVGDAQPAVLDAIDRRMIARLAVEPAVDANFAERSYVVRSDVTMRTADFMKDGPRLDERVAVESEMLERQTSRTIESRFRDTPITSMTPLPDRGEARRAWLEDALRAEHVAAREGLMHPEAVVRAAQARRGPVPSGREPAPYVRDVTRDAHLETAIEAARIRGMSDASLRLRFRDVPGADAAPLPSADAGGDRVTWIETALMAQKVRQAMARDDGRTGLVLSMAQDRAAVHDRVRSGGVVHVPQRPLSPRAAMAHSFAVDAMIGRG